MKSIIAMMVLFVSVSCSKSSDVIPPPKSIAQLLTQKEWMLTSFGLDLNKNDMIEMQEEWSEDCQRDNLFRFNADGTGLFKENLKSCNTGVTEQPFNWTLEKNGKELDFVSGILQVLRITELEMVLFHEMEQADGTKMRVYIIYKH